MLKAKLKSLQISRLRPFFLPGAIVFLILTSGFFLIRPRLGETLLIQRNLKKEEKRLAQLTAKTAVLEGFDQAELSERAELAAKAIPTEKNLPLLLTTLKTLSAKNNIELLSLQITPGELATPSAKNKNGRLSFLSFQVSVSGQMGDFREFLAQLAKTAPLVRAKRVDIDIQEKGGRLRADILLEAPYLSPPVSLGSSEEPLAQITPEEVEAFQKLAQLDFSATKEEVPSAPVGKENPFTF